MTKAEIILWTVLKGRALGWKFRRQHPIGPYIADFACLEAGLVVEVDGATHASDAQTEKDVRRTYFLKAQGFSVLRVTNLDIYEDLDGVVRGICAALTPLGPSGHSPRKRGETPVPPYDVLPRLRGRCQRS
jgi:very-short-patch-repair endonuclease